MGISTPSPDVVSDLVPRARRPRPRAPWLALAVLLWLPAAAVATIDAARLGAGTTPLCRFLEVTWVEFPCMAGAPPWRGRWRRATAAGRCRPSRPARRPRWTGRRPSRVRVVPTRAARTTTTPVTTPAPARHQRGQEPRAGRSDFDVRLVRPA